MEDLKYSNVHYKDYLGLNKILSAQHPRSGAIEGNSAHEEMLFIIVHQAYELWFKQIIHELESVRDMFRDQQVDERNINVSVHRLNRVKEIFQLLIQQISIMQTMTPLDFLDFRSYLFPASGFQSFQFRKIENLLGLKSDQRIKLGGCPYTSVFNKEQADDLAATDSGNSLFDYTEDWLERTPFLEMGDYRFLDHYQKSVQEMLFKEEEEINQSGFLTEDEKMMRLNMLGSTNTYFNAVFDKNVHLEKINNGEVRLSYKASIAALLINLYRDEPILHQPFNYLTCLMDIDEMLTTWRFRHSQMVMRMLGNKIGTGGSSGYQYLRKTAERHHIYRDLLGISTLMIPRSRLPQLPRTILKNLGFYFNSSHQL